MTDYSYGTTGDYYTAKYAAANGALLWEKRYNGPANSEDYANAVAVDGSGNVLVTGTSPSSGGYGDYYTVKYAAADGALLWEKRYNGTGNSTDVAQAMAVDGSGNVVVTGYSLGSEGSYDYYTAKYASANGTLLWEKRYNSPGNFHDLAQALAADGSGNVVVTGYSWNGSNPDYYTTKYAAADGTLLWEKRYNGPANSQDLAYAVAVDGSGNVVVTGSSGNGLNNEYYTVKYAATNGVLLWEKRYNRPDPADRADSTAVAVDDSGNVVVTGSSSGSGYEDYYTAKYAAADGALLWEKRHTGGSARSLALGPNGMVAVTGSSYRDYATARTDYGTVLYREAVPPVISCSTNLMRDCSGSAGRRVDYSVTATDGSGHPATVLCVPTSGAIFPIGLTTVTCIATNGDGLSSVCSFNVTWRDTTAPVITSSPENRTNIAGDTAVFSVDADSCGPVTYQWWRDATALAGETNANLALTNFLLTHAGNYRVVLTNGAGSTTSQVATLTVLLPTYIVAALANGLR